MNALLVGCLLVAVLANTVALSVLLPFGKSQGDRQSNPWDQPVVLRFPPSTPLVFQCHKFPLAVVHQFGQVSLEDNSSSLLLSRFFPEKASYLIQFDSVPKYRLHYRTSEAQRDRARVSRILRAVAGLNFKALWAVILTFQEADARGKLTKKQREEASSQIVLAGDSKRSFAVFNCGNVTRPGRVLFRGPGGDEKYNTGMEILSNVQVDGRWLYEITCKSTRPPSLIRGKKPNTCCGEAVQPASMSGRASLYEDKRKYEVVAKLPDVPVPVLGNQDSCDFEKKPCLYWQQSLDSNADWTLNTGTTPSDKTGPLKGNANSKSYLYLEASAARPGNKAILESRPFPATDPLSSCELSFAYHMYSTPKLKGMGTLIVKILGVESKSESVVWQRSGNQGEKWKKARLLLTSQEPFQVLLVAVRGLHHTSDIAIDDVSYSTYCRYRTCETDGIAYLHGYSWSTEDGCKQCVCDDGITYCTKTQCNFPEGCIKFADPSPGQCCPVCLSKGEPNTGALGLSATVQCVSGNTTRANGSVWQETECLQCWCNSGVTSCFTLPVCQTTAISPTILLDTTPPIILPAACTFENEIGLCEWQNDPAGDVQWQRRQGSTPTPNTGPSVDHTLGTVSGHYLYMESSQPTAPDNRAILVGPVVSKDVECGDLDDNMKCAIQFWYHMYGDHTGTLAVSARLATGAETELWKKERDQGNAWHEAIVPLQLPYEDFQVVFTAVRAEGYRGDIAIDDVAWIPYSVPVEPSEDPGPDMELCTFENGFCRWISLPSAEVQWMRHQGSTPTRETGPSVDHTLGTENGYYIYFESSSPAQRGDRAILQDKPILPGVTVCGIYFWYHMYGQVTGTLTVTLQPLDGGDAVTLWELSGEQENRWLEAKVQFPSLDGNHHFQVMFTATRANGYVGDIALDDIQYKSCVSEPTPPAPQTTPPTTATPPVTCSMPCQNGGTCTGNDICSCTTEYEGQYCQTPIVICDQPCENGGSCTGRNKCTCLPGFDGQYCQMSSCSQPCSNGGVCRGVNQCDCLPGYTGTLCTNDINECVNNVCDPNAACQNTFGSFMCVCLDGFTGEGRNCIRIKPATTEPPTTTKTPTTTEPTTTAKATTGQPLPTTEVTHTPSPQLFTGRLLYADFRSVRACYLHLHVNESSSTLYPAKKGYGAEFVDYHIASSSIYWTDLRRHAIRSGDLLGNSAAADVIEDPLLRPEGVAVDWVGGNLYFIDTMAKAIKVISLDGSKLRLLFFRKLDNPRAIVLDPERGYFYWSDWSLSQPSINRATMDGNNRLRIIAGNLRFPNGLAIDYTNQYIYWTDSGINRIERSRLNGQGRELVLKLPAAHYPFGIDILDGYVYYSHGRKPGVIYRVSKDLATPTPVCKSKRKITSIRGIDSRQSDVKNGCGSCASDQMCLMSPQGSLCVCPTDSSGNPIATCGIIASRR